MFRRIEIRVIWFWCLANPEFKIWFESTVWFFIISHRVWLHLHLILTTSIVDKMIKVLMMWNLSLSSCYLLVINKYRGKHWLLCSKCNMNKIGSFLLGHEKVLPYWSKLCYLKISIRSGRFPFHVQRWVLRAGHAFPSHSFSVIHFWLILLSVIKFISVFSLSRVSVCCRIPFCYDP